MIPVILGVVLLTFFLFAIAAPDPAQAFAGKHRSETELRAIRHQMGLDKPLWINLPQARHTGHWGDFFNSQFFDILLFRFPPSMHYGESVWSLFRRKAPVSFAIQFPIFIVLIGVQLVLAIAAARSRGKPLDRGITILAVAILSVPGLSILLAAQSFFGGHLHWFPVAGWAPGIAAIHFAALPILVSILAGWGGGARFYRTVVLEEMGQDYIRTARAKGVSPREVLFTHTMRNIMIPVITNTITALPFLFLGALLLERIFQIPGIGGMLVDAINNQDRAIVMFTTYITAVAYAIMLLINDILYTLADPRVSLH
jgi:peptide/nickel transport system permease protein